jgi:hypothetical protein
MAATTAAMSTAAAMSAAAMSAEATMSRQTVAPTTMHVGHFGMTIPVTMIPTVVPAAPPPIGRAIGRIGGIAGHGSAVANALHASGQQEADTDHEWQRRRNPAATHRNLRCSSSSIFHARFAITGYILS